MRAADGEVFLAERLACTELEHSALAAWQDWRQISACSSSRLAPLLPPKHAFKNDSFATAADSQHIKHGSHSIQLALLDIPACPGPGEPWAAPGHPSVVTLHGIRWGGDGGVPHMVLERAPRATLNFLLHNGKLHAAGDTVRSAPGARCRGRWHDAMA